MVRHSTAPLLSRRALNRTLLGRQRLLERVTMPAAAVMEHLVGMQAQEPPDPYVALWSRIAGFDPAELSDLIRDRRAVRIGLMRTTLHLVTARDCRALYPVMADVLARTFRNTSFAKRLDGLDTGPVVVAARPRDRLGHPDLVLAHGASRVVERLRPQLRTYRDEAGRELFDVADGRLVDPEVPAPVRFLPQYDNIFLSHDDRSRIVGGHVAGHEFGWKGMVLIDGFIDGAWRIRRERTRATMTVELFKPLRGVMRVEAEEEAARLFAFRAAEADRDLRIVEAW